MKYLLKLIRKRERKLYIYNVKYRFLLIIALKMSEHKLVHFAIEVKVDEDSDPLLNDFDEKLYQE